MRHVMAVEGPQARPSVRAQVGVRDVRGAGSSCSRSAVLAPSRSVEPFRQEERDDEQEDDCQDENQDDPPDERNHGITSLARNDRARDTETSRPCLSG